jgi:hypothetical protein
LYIFFEGEIIELVKNWPKDKLIEQILSVQERTSLNLPRKEDYVRLPNIDYHAVIEPYDACVGGDQLAIIDFRKYAIDDNHPIDDMILDAKKSGKHDYAARLEKNLDMIGIWISDALGHDLGASIPNTYLHGALQMGLDYELMLHGEVTADLFRRLNMKFYDRLQADYLTEKPYVTMLYGEIYNDGKFRFLSAGHPLPIIFSNEYNKIISLNHDSFNISTPLGVIPWDFPMRTKNFSHEYKTKDNYPINEVNLLGMGDILILHTDGLSEQKDGEMNFCENRLEQVLREVKTGTAKEIYTKIRIELESYCPPSDDLTLVVMKKI